MKISQLNLNDAKLKYNDYNQNISQEIATLERKIQTTSLDIENLKNQIEKNKIYATISGIVTEFPLYEGRKTLNTDKVFIHNTNAFEFVSNVAQDDAVLLREGQKAKVWLDGIKKEYDAEVTQISKAAQQDQQSGSKTPKVEVKISLTNPDNLIISGFNAESNITIDSLENVLAIKNECIKTDKENKTYVYLIENNTAIIKYVEIGLSDGYKTQIKSGLNENDKVVINPPIELTDGQKVNVVKEDTNGL